MQMMDADTGVNLGGNGGHVLPPRNWIGGCQCNF